MVAMLSSNRSEIKPPTGTSASSPPPEEEEGKSSPPDGTITAPTKQGVFKGAMERMQKTHTQGGEEPRRGMERISMARPSWDDEMRQAALDTLDSLHWVKGPQGKAFGSEFASYSDAVQGTPCQSGSVALGLLCVC